ncbi:MAG: hypothetical protein ABI835_11080 [Chloroflexota bacterium]
MAGLAHVITVDPTGATARIVRGALELTGQRVIQIDLRWGEDALDEIQHTGCQLLVTALRLSDSMHGVDLAAQVKQGNPDAVVIVLGDEDDPPELDAEMLSIAPFVYLHRPMDGAQFMRVLAAGLGLASAQDMGSLSAGHAPSQRQAEGGIDLGPIPPLDMKVAERVVDSLLIDVGAMAIVVANRAGVVLLERGAVGYLNREQLTSALLPTIRSTVEMGQLVGGQPAALQFYDGDTYDVFVLSIGFHHFMCLVFDGQGGSRQFGAVNRFGRRAAEDLIAMLGINAFAIAQPQQAETSAAHSSVPDAALEADPLIERAEAWTLVEREQPPEPEPIRLEPIENFDLNMFSDTLFGELDTDAANDLFDPDKLAEIANETRRDRGPLSYDEARELGIIP